MKYQMLQYFILEDESQKKIFDTYLKLFPFNQKTMTKKLILKLLKRGNE